MFKQKQLKMKCLEWGTQSGDNKLLETTVLDWRINTCVYR